MRTLSAKGLTKVFGDRKVVDDITLEINTEKVIGLLGPNGAGKTTIFFMMVGLIKPDQGRN